MDSFLEKYTTKNEATNGGKISGDYFWVRYMDSWGYRRLLALRASIGVRSAQKKIRRYFRDRKWPQRAKELMQGLGFSAQDSTLLLQLAGKRSTYSLDAYDAMERLLKNDPKSRVAIKKGLLLSLPLRKKEQNTSDLDKALFAKHLGLLIRLVF